MIRIFDALEGLSQEAAQIFVESSGQAVAESGSFSVALSGGNTPRRLYEILSRAPFSDLIPWQNVHIFWGDERCVPADDPRSNFHMARETLLDQVPIPSKNVHPMRAWLPPSDAAANYETELRGNFGDQIPSLDLVFLGLGDNAHTASLFPHTEVLNETKRWVAEVYVAELDMFRITLTAPVLNCAKQVVFLVSGAGKAHALQEVLEGAYRPQVFPAQLIHHPLWLVDKAAAHKLTEPLDAELAD